MSEQEKPSDQAVSDAVGVLERAGAKIDTKANFGTGQIYLVVTVPVGGGD